MFRVVVTAARDLPEPEIVWVPLWCLLHQQRAIIVTHGANPSGGDLYVHQWFELPEQTFNRDRRRHEDDVDYLAIEDPHPADWSRGKVGGNIRNQEMINTGPDEVYAVPTPSSSGTLDCMARAWVRGVPVRVWHYLELGHSWLLSDDEGEHLARKRLGWGR
jgi:hypothetical protein